MKLSKLLNCFAKIGQSHTIRVDLSDNRKRKAEQ